MFLDEELEKVYAENRNAEESILKKEIFKVLTSRLPNPKSEVYKGVDDFLCRIKQIDNGWKLFVSRHPGFNKNMWRQYIILIDRKGKLKKALNW